MATSVLPAAEDGGSAPPPTPQEIQRKLSVHNRPAKPVNVHAVSGTESDSDSFSPEYSPLNGSHFSGGSHPYPINQPHTHGHGHSMSQGLSTSASSKPLSSIAERRSGSGDEESEDDEDQEGDEELEHGASSATPRKRPDGDSVIKSSYLLKKGERRKTWKKRWFVLRSAEIAVYKSSAEYKLLRLLDLSEVHSCSPVALKRHASSFVVVFPTRTYYLQAQNDADMHDWVDRINEAREALLGTSTHNSMSTPIAIPSPPGDSHYSRTLVQSPPPMSGGGGGNITPSPPSARSIGFAGPVTSESDSEDPNAGENVVQSGSSPSKVKSSGAASLDPSKAVLSGYLMKCRSKRRGWRKRYFILNGERLLYSASHMDTKRQRSIELSQVIDAMEYNLAQSSTSPPTGDHGRIHDGEAANGSLGGNTQFTFKIVFMKGALVLSAPSEAEMIKWLSTVRALIARRTSPPGSGSPPILTGQAGVAQPLDGAVVGGAMRPSASTASRKRSASGASNFLLSSREEQQHH